MGAMRLLPVLLLVILLGGQLPLMSNLAYATCMCDQACPQPRGCGACDPGCPHTVPDSFQNYTLNSKTIELRSVRSSAPFTLETSGTDVRKAATILAMPQKFFVKLQCQRIKEMLNWASDLHVKGPESSRNVLF